MVANRLVPVGSKQWGLYSSCRACRCLVYGHAHARPDVLNRYTQWPCVMCCARHYTTQKLFKLDTEEAREAFRLRDYQGTQGLRAFSY
jgi:hypothetical protein